MKMVSGGARASAKRFREEGMEAFSVQEHNQCLHFPLPFPINKNPEGKIEGGLNSNPLPVFHKQLNLARSGFIWEQFGNRHESFSQK